MQMKSVVSQSVSADTLQQQKPVKRKKILLIFFLGVALAFLVILAVIVYAVVIPGQQILNSVRIVTDQVSVLANGLASKNISEFEKTVAVIDTEFANINAQLDRFDFLNQYEFTKGYYGNVLTLKKLNTQFNVLVSTAYPEIKTTLKALGYNTEPAVVLAEGEVPPLASETELDSVIKELPELVRLYEKYESQIAGMMATVQEFDANFIPPIGPGAKAADLLRKVQDATEDFPTTSAKLKDILRVTPELLGAISPVSYLVIFQNEKELRSSGGLLSSYAILTLDKGEIVGTLNTIDMWELHNQLAAIGRHPGFRDIYGQAALMPRGCGPQVLRPQDVGIYPDLNLTMDMFTDYYDLARKYVPSKYPDYQHVIIINTFFASDLVSLIDPIVEPITGRTITEENLAREIFTTTALEKHGSKTRKSFIGQVADVAQQKFRDLSSDQLLDVLNKMLTTVIQKNIGMQSKNAKVQQFINEFELGGKIENNFAGDYFQLGEAQNCALKANFFIRDIVTQNIKIADNGSIKKDINVQWRNEHVYAGGEDAIISNSSRFFYRSWARVMAPQGTVFTSSDGLKKSGIIRYNPVVHFDQKMQKQISENVIRFDHRRPNASAPIKYHDLNVSYNLPGNLNYNADKGYRMLIQKHPGKRDEYYKINIQQGGATTSTEFTLDRDKIVYFKNGVLSVENYAHKLDEYTKLVDTVKGFLL